MRYNYWMDVCAFVLLVILIILYLTRHSVKLLQNSFFYSMVMSALFATDFNILSVAVSEGAPSLLMVVKSIVLSLDLLTAVLFAFYITSYAGYQVRSRKVMKVLFPPAIICALGIIINPFTGILYTVDGGYGITWQPLSVLYFLSLMYYLFYTIVLLLRVRDTMSREKLFLIVPFAFLISFASYFEYTNTEFLGKHFAEALLGVVLYFGLRNPDELYDEVTGMLNDAALTSFLEKRLVSDRRIFIVAIKIHDVELLRKTIGAEAGQGMRDRIAELLYAYSKDTMAFAISSGLYCIVTDRPDRTYAANIQNDLSEKLSRTFYFDKARVDISSSLCLIEMPQDAKDTTALMDVIRLFAEVGEKRNMSVVSTADLDLRHIAYMRTIDEKVRNAISDGKLEVYYQPIFSCKKMRFVAAEALLRMHDDEHGFVSPEIFVPVAENNGSIVKIDNFVIEQVCSMISRNDIKSLGVDYIEVNLSPGDCIQDDLVGKISGLLEHYHIEPSSINLEITETAPDEFTGIVDRNVKALNDLGINFSLDDFGTGYSSLSRILTLPLKIIKLDKTLVQPAFRAEAGSGDDERTKNIKNSNPRLMLESYVEMIKNIGDDIVAEGVETKEQAEEIIRMGCDYIQGFYFARPMPEADFIRVLKEGKIKQIAELQV
ncbi:MAG: EAL domain-containing protein [Lachnospiraceae bacterium]|nr:EAL domain-containing protein [Lachnospiraceae bacterium]